MFYYFRIDVKTMEQQKINTVVIPMVCNQQSSTNPNGSQATLIFYLTELII